MLPARLNAVLLWSLLGRHTGNRRRCTGLVSTHVHELHCCLPAVVGSVWRRAGQMAASTRGRQASSTEKDVEEALAPPTPLQKLGKKTKSTITKLQVCAACANVVSWNLSGD